MRGAIAAAAVAALCLVPAPSDACIHAGGGGGGPVAISQKGQHAAAFFDGETEHLVVKIEYAADQPLDALGLVMPVPAVPKGYGAARPGLFDELHDWAGLERRRPAARSRGGGGGGGGSSRSPLRMLPAAEAGPYRIQPMQASGQAGVTALRTWMEENDFAPIPAEALSYFAERDWTFLAVRVDPAEGADSLEASGGLPPLRVSFDTTRIVYPLKLEAQGVFPVRFYVVTPEPLEREAFDDAIAKGFALAGNRRMHGTSSLRARRDDFDVDESPEALRWLMQELGAPFSDGTHHLHVLFAQRFGAGDADPRAWDEELTIPPVPEGERVEGVVATAEPERQAAGEQEATETARAETEEPAPAPARVADEPDGCEGCSTAGGSPATALPVLVALALVLRSRRRQ